MKYGRSQFLLLIPLLFFLLASAVAIADEPTRPHKPDELIIKFKPNVPQSQKDAILADLGSSHLKHFKKINADHKHIQGVTVGNAIGRYKNHPAIEYIEPNYILTANDIPTDPRFDELWGMLNTGQTGGTAGADIDATIAWDVFTGSHDIVVGVIDTGVDYNHPDLAANMWTNPGEIPGNGIDDDGNGFVDDVHGWDFINGDNDPMDDNGHGTHCSGTIGAIANNGVGVVGVSPNVSIMALKFLSAGGSGSSADAIDCLEYATMMGANLTSNSWGGGGFSQAMADAIADAGANNALFVAAAGNSSSNNDVSPHYPSSYDLDNVVAVASTDHNDQLSSFSSYGATSVDIAAPGSDILSTLPGNSYGVLSGTSMATPHVSGALALIAGRFPAIDALDAKALLLNFADPLEDLDGVVLSGARLNAFWPIAEPDSIPPAQITDLAVTLEGSNWLDVQWTAVGDDVNTGKASRYDLRYATFPIDEFNWETATRVNGTPKPGDPGTLESMRITGLDFTTTYYVAVMALDEFGNPGGGSPNAMGTTLGAPDIDVDPIVLSEALLTGGTSFQTLTMSNLGAGTLDYVIPSPVLLGGPVANHEYVPVAKGGMDLRTGGPVFDSIGGPDAFGYRWVDNNDPFGPTFAWNDISGSGSVAVSSGDDVTQGPFPIGFDFPFYGGDFSEFYVCSNGFISLSSTSSDYGNQPLPTTGAPAHLIAPFWDDLNVESGGTVYFHSDGSRLIVQWENVNHYGSGGPYSFQAVIYPDGLIEYYYNSMSPPTGECTVGIQNGTGTDGLTVAFNTDYVTDGLAVQFRAIPQWMTVDPAEGTVWAPGSTDLTVNFDASGLLGGTYDGIIRIVSNDPDEGEYEVPVTLVVTGAPDIAVDPTFYDFGGLFLGATAQTTVEIRNVGTDVLTITDVSSSDPVVFAHDGAPAALPPGGTQIVTVTFAPTMAQVYGATLTIQSDDPLDPVMTVDLVGEGQTPPDFDVTPRSLTSNLYTGESESHELLLTNSGGADFEFDLSIDFHNDVTVHEYVEVGKEEIDTRVGEPVLLGAGGPDVYGYNWIDSDEPGGPVYSFTDISATGTPVFSGTADDRNEGPFPIGFDFNFYGTQFSEFNVCSNGFVSFTSTSTSYSNQALPNGGAPENLLAPFWDDLRIDTSTGANVFYEYDGSRLIIQYHRVPAYYATGEHTFQVILYPDGSILYQYENMDSTDLQLCTVGIQNGTQDDGLTVAFNTPYVKNGLAVRFQAFPEWLTVSPASGVVPPGGSLPVTANFNAAEMFGGTYEADIVIDSNDPSLPTLPIPATLYVTGAPDLFVAPDFFDFGVNFVGTPTLRDLVITNLGTDDLNISAVTISNGDFNTNLTPPVVLGATETLVATVGFTASSVGLAEGVLTIESDDPDFPVYEIPLSGEGVLPPQASVDPTTLASNLFTGESETQYLTLSNTGDSDLTWDANVMLGAAEVAVFETIDLDKGVEDTNPGVLGSGGPDVYGYRWTDSDEPGGPLYEWTDISATGTPVFSGVADDVNTGPFEIGFAFPFYGTPFTQFRISSNGFVSFTSTSSDLSNAPLPGTGAPENLLAIFHDDLRVDTGAGNNVYYQNIDGKLIVQWDGVPKYSTNGAQTFQAVLYPTGTIMYYYQSLTATILDSATIGIQNATRDDGLTVVYNDDYIHDEMAIRIAPVSDFLAVSPTSGTVPAGGSQTLDVIFSAAGMFGGVYDGAVMINNNDPANGLIEVPATLTVTGVPVAAVDPAALDFGDVFIGYPEVLELTVSNVGTDLLTVTDIVSTGGDFTVTPTAFDLDPFEAQAVTVTFAPSSEGVISADLQVMSNDANSPALVSVTGVGVTPPDANWSPTTMVGAAMPGDTKVKQMTLCNDGGSDLVWTLKGSESIASDMVVYSELKLGKEEEDPRPGILGSGGPDTYGHTWIDSDDPNGPAFVWNDISGTGTAIFGQYEDDDNYGPQPIGFDFNFYGNDFSEFYVCSNGWLSFTNSSLRTYTNQPLPNNGSSVPENLIAPFWDDMVVDPVTRGLDVHYLFDGEKLIVQYDIRRIATFNPPYYSFQVQLYPNGNIMFLYDTLGTTTSSATIGIQNGAKDDGLMMVYNDDYVHEDMAILITSAPSWLSVGTESGVIPAGECVDIDVIMDASALEEGDHYGTLTLTSNDPADPTKTMDVIFHVGSIDAVDTALEPDTLNLGSNGKFMTGYVELPEGYDPMDVVIETVSFNGTVYADPKFGIETGDFNENGIPDLMFKFSRSEIEALLLEGEEVTVTVTGEIRDTTWFVATDVIRVINPTLTMPNGGEYYPIMAEVDIAWDNPTEWTVDYADIYLTVDGGETWSLIAGEVPGDRYTWTTPETPSDETMIRVLVFDRDGLLGFDTSDEPFIITSGASSVENIIPVVYGLAQNYPNPFNPQTHIKFDLPKAGKTHLTVYDIRGRKVIDLVDGHMDVGRHTVLWTGKDGSGRQVASGVYYYRIKSGEFSDTKRMTLIK